MLAAGAAAGLHCVGMCGGIVTAFSGRVIPIRPEGPARWARQLAFNAGRITAYCIAGGLAGALGAAAYAASALPLQQALNVAASAMLIFTGLYLVGADRWLRRLEIAGVPLWARLQPLAARLSRGASLPRAYAAGFAWGWLPCAMVYAALAAAALAGDPARGALAMAAFGLGTLPFLLAAGWLAARVRAWRPLAGSLVIAFGAFGFAHAGNVGEGIRRSLLCF